MIRTTRIFRKYAGNRQFLDVKISLSLGRTSSCLYSVDGSLDVKRGRSELYRHLYSKILACGPMTVADYMKEILTHPSVGYYMKKDVFGERGDFVTSPEITQLFGEMVAIWMVYELKKITLKPFQIVELGPGRGTLTKDLLRVFRQLKLLERVSIHLVEVSPTLSKIQAENLCMSYKEHEPQANENKDVPSLYYRKGVTGNGVNVYWYYSINDVPKNLSVFLAHEFFDALPIHKLQKTSEGWCEVLVDIVEGTSEEKFRYVLSKGSTAACQFYLSEDERREHVEVSPQTMVTIDYMSQFLLEHGGFALIFDYGHSGEGTDTFRAFREHKLHDPLLNPGTADLTADVDFSVMKKIAEKDDRLLAFGPVKQSSFLRDLGIDVRLFNLLTTASKEQRKQLESGYHMIMDDDKMGTRFKVMSLFPHVLKELLQKCPVAGFSGTEDPKTSTKN